MPVYILENKIKKGCKTMDIYRYRFPAFGTADGMPNFTATMLEDKLSNGEENLGNYYVFRSKDNVLGKVTTEIDAKDNAIAVNLFTVEPIRKGSEDSFMECVQKNLAIVAWENYDDPHSCIILDGIMQNVGREQEKYIDEDWEEDFVKAVSELPFGNSIINL